MRGIIIHFDDFQPLYISENSLETLELNLRALVLSGSPCRGFEASDQFPDEVWGRPSSDQYSDS